MKKIFKAGKQGAGKKSVGAAVSKQFRGIAQQVLTAAYMAVTVTMVTKELKEDMRAGDKKNQKRSS